MLMPSSGSLTFDSASSTRSLRAGTPSPSAETCGAPSLSAESISLIGSTSRIFYRRSPIRQSRGAAVPMRVLIVDDHPVTLGGLKTALSSSDEVEIVGEASTGEEAVDAVGRLHPDVVFMDVRM